jgi:hypothetical protein
LIFLPVASILAALESRLSFYFDTFYGREPIATPLERLCAGRRRKSQLMLWAAMRRYRFFLVTELSRNDPESDSARLRHQQGLITAAGVTLVPITRAIVPGIFTIIVITGITPAHRAGSAA